MPADGIATRPARADLVPRCGGGCSFLECLLDRCAIGSRQYAALPAKELQPIPPGTIVTCCDLDARGTAQEPYRQPTRGRRHNADIDDISARSQEPCADRMTEHDAALARIAAQDDGACR